VLHEGRVLAFRAIDPTSKKEYFFLPGGEIEPDETAPEAAVRETLEETGYLIEVFPQCNTDKEYFFHWNGQDYSVLTIFYRGRLVDPNTPAIPVNDADYNKGAIWIDRDKIDSVFSYNDEILTAIHELIDLI
jgi:tRNA(adenine34) deaminase